MRITWFGGSSFRLYAGGKITVTDPDTAPAGIDRAELTAAADEVVAASGAGLPILDPETWRPARRRREIDAPAAGSGFRIFGLLGGGLLIDAPDDGPLILAPLAARTWGRFADDAVIVLHGAAADAPEAVKSLAAARPRLVALAVPPLTNAEFAAIAQAAAGAPLQILEAGLGLEA